jgi:hypothetical protein
MSAGRPVPIGDNPASVCPQPSRDCDTCRTIAADAGDAAKMVVSSRTEATIETLELPNLQPEAARALRRLVRQAQERAAARATKGAA